MTGLPDPPVSCVQEVEEEVLDMVCSICEEAWASNRLEEHTELCAVLRKVRAQVLAARNRAGDGTRDGPDAGTGTDKIRY